MRSSRRSRKACVSCRASICRGFWLKRACSRQTRRASRRSTEKKSSFPPARRAMQSSVRARASSCKLRHREVPRFRSLLTLFILASALVWPSFARAANDPELVYKTLESPHFRITFYSGEEEIARHVADLAEDINARLVPVLGWQPKEKVEIALNDQTDSANGFTSAAPYNAIRLFVTAPDDLSPLGDVDDWYQELVTHEYTHTLHLDNITGIPALWNAIVGRAWVPNQIQPRWILEGL